MALVTEERNLKGLKGWDIQWNKKPLILTTKFMCSSD